MNALARQRHRRHANPFTLRGPVAVPNWDVIFGRAAPMALDIGCGPGRFVCDLAAARPDLNVVGVEIRQHLVDNVLATAKELGLPHVHALLCNANDQLPGILPDNSLAFVSVNFPDPWYKKRHHKRRVMRNDLLDALLPKLRPGARIHAMTDYQPVGEEMLAVLNEHPAFQNLEPAGGLAPHTTTGLTSEREIKHLQRGEQIYRMHFAYGLAKPGTDPVKAGDPHQGW